VEQKPLKDSWRKKEVRIIQNKIYDCEQEKVITIVTLIYIPFYFYLKE